MTQAGGSGKECVCEYADIYHDDCQALKELSESQRRLGVARKALKRAIEHSCELEGADFGYFSCCQMRDYEGHKPNCYLKIALAEIGEEPTSVPSQSANGRKP